MSPPLPFLSSSTPPWCCICDALLTIMLCVAPQLLFAATLAASINKEQQSRQAMGARHKAIITYESTSESIKRLLVLALQSLVS